VNNKELEFADCRRSENQRKNVKHAVGLVIAETRKHAVRRQPKGDRAWWPAKLMLVCRMRAPPGAKETFEWNFRVWKSSS
jgi:hypothetical protein